ncbi:MAG: glycosyltransferase family 2 protein [Candidatus Scalindua sp.]
MHNEKYVSLVIPIFNEKKHINLLLNSLLNQDYPNGKFEILLIDGRSEDGTREEIEKFITLSSKFKDPYIAIIDNPKKIVPCALNIGIKRTKGDYIIRMDAHTEYAFNYISKCIEWLENTGVENVGGPIESMSGENTLIAKTIALVSSNIFGVGNSKFRTSQKAGYVDTVTFGSWPRRVFEEVGLFDERLVRNQDIEFNARIRKAGGKIYLTPEIKSFYHCRSTLKGLWKQNFENGKWGVYTKKIAPYCLSWRHFIPLLFVVSLIVSGLISVICYLFEFNKLSTFYFLLSTITISGSYLFANLFFSVLLTVKNGSKHFFILSIVFAVLHFSYGFGSVWGLLTLRKWIVKNR